MNDRRVALGKAFPRSRVVSPPYARLRALIAVLLAAVGLATVELALTREKRLQQESAPPLFRCSIARVYPLP